VKFTANGLRPLVGVAVKAATGKNAPVPITGLELAPSLPLVKMTALLKLVALVGTNRTTTLVEPNPARLKGVPDRIVNPLPALTEAVPLLSTAPPRFVTTKVA